MLKNSLVLFLLAILSLTMLPSIVSASSTTVQVDPSISIVMIRETFKINIIITNVTNLTCWEFKLYYLNSVLNCTTTTQGSLLRTGGGTFFTRNITNTYNATHGRVLAGCTLLGFTSVSGSGTLATITFQAKATGHTTLDLDKTYLGDENIPPEDIPRSTKDGTVQVIARILKLTPSEITCRKYCEEFTVQINVTNAVNLHDFHFEIMYNTTILDYVSVEWGELGNGTLTEVNGVLKCHVAGGPGIVVNENQWLLNITFYASYHHIWMDVTASSNWVNDLNGVIKFHWAQLTYLDGTCLIYEEDGPLKEIVVFNAWYTFMPIQGDINNDGSVSIQDISLVAYWFEQNNPAYDLNCDGTIDKFDLVIIAANLWYEYD